VPDRIDSLGRVEPKKFRKIVDYCTKRVDPSRLLGFLQTIWFPAVECCRKRRSDSSLLTAGPYEADSKFLPGSRPAAVPQPRTISFEPVKPMPKELAALSDAMTTWNNDNEWYPVKDIEWILDDDSAAVLIFGVTAK